MTPETRVLATTETVQEAASEPGNREVAGPETTGAGPAALSAADEAELDALPLFSEDPAA
jgi:hypothetical protein